jgi:hypothetical protein
MSYLSFLNFENQILIKSRKRRIKKFKKSHFLFYSPEDCGLPEHGRLPGHLT